MSFKSSYGKTPDAYDGPKEIGALVHIGTDGKFAVEVLPGWSCQASQKNSSNAYFEGSVRIVDADFAGTIVPNARVMFIGADKNGLDFITKTNDMLISCGVETLESIKAKKAANVPVDSDEVIAKIAGKRAYVMLSTEYTDRGNPKTVVGSFITAKDYEEATALKQTRWAAKLKGTAPVQNGATPAPYQAGGAAAGAPQTAF